MAAAAGEDAEMAAGKWKVYDFAKLYVGNGTLNLGDNTNWKVALLSSASNANTLSLGTGIYGDLTGELTTANGYTAGGVAITPTWTRSGSTCTFTSDSPVWNVTGSSIAPRYAVAYKNATINTIVKPLLAVMLLDTTPADVTVTAGNPLTLAMNASGIWTFSGATAD